MFTKPLGSFPAQNSLDFFLVALTYDDAIWKSIGPSIAEILLAFMVGCFASAEGHTVYRIPLVMALVTVDVNPSRAFTKQSDR